MTMKTNLYFIVLLFIWLFALTNFKLWTLFQPATTINNNNNY